MLANFMHLVKISQTAPQPMCVVQQAVKFGMNSMSYSYNMEVHRTTMKHI